MKLSHLLAAKLLVGAYYLIDGANAVCQQDNCFRALFPSTDPVRLASAQSFCHTYTEGASTVTTGFPPRYTAGCGSAPSRYSSVCSCAATVSVTTTTTPMTSTTATTLTAPTCAPTPYEQFQNGDFECGSLYPWRALVTEGTTYALTPPGSTGSYAFEVEQNAPLDGVGLGEANIQQLFYITPGT